MLARTFAVRIPERSSRDSKPNNPHICQIYDIGPDYLVLEYLEGEQLRGPVAPEEAVRLFSQIADLRTGRVGVEELDVLTLSETIVPVLVTAAAPVVAGDQIILLLGNYRGDIWIRDID